MQSFFFSVKSRKKIENPLDISPTNYYVELWLQKNLTKKDTKKVTEKK